MLRGLVWLWALGPVALGLALGLGWAFPNAFAGHDPVVCFEQASAIPVPDAEGRIIETELPSGRILAQRSASIAGHPLLTLELSEPGRTRPMWLMRSPYFGADSLTPDGAEAPFAASERGGRFAVLARSAPYAREALVHAITLE
jgi:hypothetical protein